MLNISEIYHQFSLLSGLDMEETRKWSHLCAAADRDVQDMLKDGVDTGAQRARLVCAVAALAYYRYVMFRTAEDQADSFDAGDFRVRYNKTAALAAAKEAWASAMVSISGLIRDNGFAVKST